MKAAATVSVPAFYPIGTLGQPWGDAQRILWRARQTRQRSYDSDVLQCLTALNSPFAVQCYGALAYGGERYELMAAHSRNWQSGLPAVLITGGVHGYETSGVHGALRFLQTHAESYTGRVNLLVVPCVSPWGYERIQRWNFDAIDPNRSFVPNSPAQECTNLLRLIDRWAGQFVAHIDLHETTDSDESEFRPALAARDGKPFEPCTIPDGFYLVDDAANPQPAFQQAILAAVERVTHVAAEDAQGLILDALAVAPGVIRYAVKALGLCTCITGARYTTTTEVYPDSPRATPEQCMDAQVAALRSGLDFVCEKPSRLQPEIAA